MHTVAVVVLCVAVGGIAAQWLAWRLRLPAIVLLFTVGLIAGPGLQILHPADFGPALRPMIGLAVAIVVFEGGLALDLRELKAAGEGVLRLTAVALPINAVLGTMAAKCLTSMGWGAACLFGAITVVTGPTVVLPLLRHTRLHRRAASFLKWEAIANDPVGAILAALVLQILIARPQTIGWSMVLQLLGGLVIASGLGVGAALLVSWLFRNDQAPEVLKTPILLALAMGVYVVSNLAMDDAGLMASTLFGVTLANLHVPGVRELRRFKESLVVLVVSALFITLTAAISRQMVLNLSWPLAALTVAMMVLVRPLAIITATVRSQLSWPERLLPAWIAPRGIVAAAVAGVAGLRLQVAGYPGADQVMPAVFALIAATMILHGFTLRPVASRLRLTMGSTPGVGIVGASEWSTQLAYTLHAAGVPVLLIDIYPGALDAARRSNIPVMQAEILSEHGREELEGRPVDYLIAATADDIYNGLVCSRLAPELGRERVFQLAPASGRHDQFRGMSRDWRGKILGAPPMDFSHFERRFGRDWRFAVGQAGEGPAALVVTIRSNGGLVFASVEDNAASDPSPDDRVIMFMAKQEPALPLPEKSAMIAG